MPLDYERFNRMVVDDSASEDEGVDPDVKLPGTDVGLLKAFIAVHEQRLDVDRQLRKAMRGTADVFECLPSLDQQRLERLASIAESYEDVCERILALEGVRKETSLQSSGHRIEMLQALLGAAKALFLTGDVSGAEDCCSRALAVGVLSSKSLAAAVQAGGRTVSASTLEVWLLRSKMQLRRGDSVAARAGALEARALARAMSDEVQLEASTNLALRCEAALRGGGPGPDGRGLPMSPDEAFFVEAGNFAAKQSLAAEDPQGSDETGNEAKQQEPLGEKATSSSEVRGFELGAMD